MRTSSRCGPNLLESARWTSDLCVWRSDSGGLRLIALPWEYEHPEKPGVYGNDGRVITLTLPPGERFTALSIVVVNSSPETDVWISYSSPDGPHRIRLAMEPRTDVVQTLACELPAAPTDGQLELRALPLGLAGAVEILRVTAVAGSPSPPRAQRTSIGVHPQLLIPGLPDDCFEAAWGVLDRNLVTAVPAFGFKHPFVGPGGHYGTCWWALDSSLVWGAIKWCNAEFALANIADFRAGQLSNRDGRIDLYGMSPVRGTPSFVSSLPLLLEYAAHVARHVGDARALRLITSLIEDNVLWWLSDVKSDPATGLVTGFFEEAFGLPEDPPGRLLPVDLNVSLIVACDALIDLLRASGDSARVSAWEERRHGLATAFRVHLWDGEAGLYRDRRVGEGFLPNTLSTAFDALRGGISSPDQVSSALHELTGDRFKWHAAAPLTSMSTDSPDFTEVQGAYQLQAWRGNVWTLRNMTVVRALRECGEDTLAASLAWRTISAFANNYWEFLIAETAVGHGVADYSWSAAQTIELAIEFVFGLRYDGISKTLVCSPLPIPELYGRMLRATGLALGGAATLDVSLAWSGDGLTCDVIVHPTDPGRIRDVKAIPPSGAMAAQIRVTLHQGA